MYSLLEAYLSQVEAQLSLLPAKRRREELREMRAHLENAVSVCRERGQSDDEAGQAVVTQFGSPEIVGQETVLAWRREKRLNTRSLWGAGAATTLTLCFLLLLMDHYIGLIEYVLPRTWLLYLGRHPGYGMDFTNGTFLLTFGLAGLVAGSISPKQAVRGVCLGLAMFWIGWAAVDGIGQLQSLVTWNGLTHQGRGGWIVAAIGLAWVGSRWQQTRKTRTRQMQN